MKLSIARSELLEAMNVASKGMSSRSTLPILSGILLESSNGFLTLQSTDLEVSVRHKVAALTEVDGQVVVPGKLLSDIVRSLPEAAVVLEKEGDVVSVRCQHASFTVKTHSAADFPKFPEVSQDQTVSVPSSLLSTMVKKVSRAVSRDETRAILTGILIEIDGPEIKMVATDSYRLAVAESVVAAGVGIDQLSVVAPARALEEVTRIAPQDKEITIGVSENQLVFSFGDTTFVTRKIEGTFPNYKQLIPKDTETSIQVVTEEFQAATKRVSLLAMHNTPLRVAVKVEDQTISLSATTQDVGDASEDIMVKAEGKDVEIAFNHAFLADGLSVIADETVLLEIQSSLKPGLLRSGTDDEKFLYLLMPVRLG